MKYSKQGSGLRLNLGAGDYPLAGWVNVDCRPLAGIDLVADVRKLPIAGGVADEVYAGHVLEHLDPLDGLAALGEWWRVVRPGGILTVVTPDVGLAEERYRDGRIDRAAYDSICLGAEASGPMHHLAVYTAITLRAVLTAVVGPGTPMTPVEFAVDAAGLPTDRRLVSAIWWQCGWSVRKPEIISLPRSAPAPRSANSLHLLGGSRRLY